VATNPVYAASAYPFGRLSDTMSHRMLRVLATLAVIGQALSSRPEPQRVPTGD
jgi:hypothetical protein